MKYADAGVNIAVADEVKQRIRHHANRTFTSGVLGGIGGFGALFALDCKKWKEPVLVSSADGVGTKLKVAMSMGVHSTVGGDLVNHCINDILVQGATPLFFLDYLAMGKLDPAVIEQLVEGMSRSCRKAGCALIGGETAEMPGFYAPGEYDLAGFIVGVVERNKLLTGKSVKPGDALLALPSAGLHTNGYSLARKLIFEVANLKPDTYVAEVGNKIGAELSKAALVLRSRAKKYCRPWLGFRTRAYHRRRHSRQLAARPPGRREGANRSRLLAGAEHLQIPCRAWKNRNQRIAAILQYGRRHDPRRAPGPRQIRRSRPQTPPRKILPHRPHRARRFRQTTRRPHRLA